MGPALIIGLMVATAVVLVVGIILMARGGEANRKFGNKMMVARVVLQAAAVGLLVLLVGTHK